MIEEPLTGGNNSLEVVRVGDTVRRARDAGAEFACQVLLYLESVGYPYAPRYFGIDEHGRDILTFIPGNTTDHPTQRAPGAYACGGRMLRDLHETTAGHVLAASAECVIHGDPGPFNTVFQRGLPVAFIDWSSSRPGNRLDDLGYMAWTWCIQSQGRVPIDQQAQHLRELRDGYGDVDPERLLDAIVRRQTSIVDAEAANASNHHLTATRRQHAEAAIAWATADRELVYEHKALLLSALA
ncbi:aminoglycoside phosphotransferase family protein [Nonomuraea mesophila]|uniref:Aminoglycoside phosphotransferase family protein n=1 Tax=Nonomuraea mesophila TaxID=2530382 RepID=A0A4R5FZC2_9ACTN|nr:aminoglycoside phosphotransferase family protein [Nonomuraea mesophila]TDE60418.1 aminoglycoside phosphotransferase family protein [Nonomuraea mesophila]